MQMKRGHPMPDSTLKSTLNPNSLSPREAQREDWTQLLSSFWRAGLLIWASRLPPLPSCLHAQKESFYTSHCKKDQEEQSSWQHLTPALLRLSKDLHADECVIWFQEKRHSKQNFSLLLFLFYSDIWSNCEDEMKNNHQAKSKFP